MTLLLLLACAGEPASNDVKPPLNPAGGDGRARPDLVLVLTPGLRADPPRVEAAEDAFLDGLGAAPDLRFTAAYAQSSATYVSMGSLLTGRYATSIPLCGLFTDGVSAVETRTIQGDAEQTRLWCTEIPDRVPTLPEVLGLYGYHTAFVSAGIRGTEVLAADFQAREAIAFDKAGGTDWAALGAWTSAWWTEHAASPRLLVVAVADVQVTDRPPVLDRMGLKLLLEGAVPNPTRTDADPAEVAAVYADVAKQAGTALGGVLGKLGGERPKWTVITSTNGVSLVEPGGFWDMPVPVATTSYMLDRTARVPLFVYGPDTTAPTTVSRVVELVDLFPTFAALAGAVAPAGLPGDDLRTGSPNAGSDTAFGEFGDTLLYRRGRHELLFRSFLHHGTVLDPQLDERLRSTANQKYFTVHDVEDDPFQVKNLALQEPQLTQALRDELIRLRSGKAGAPQGVWDDPQRLWEIRMARSHGYW